MATIYSLVCFGGRTGKSVTASNSSGLIFTTSSNHGLRDATAVQFVATTLPGNVSAGVTYYAKVLSLTTFSVYTEAALTNRVEWSSAGSAVYCKSKTMLDFFTTYSGRWGSSGSERCYDSIASWISARSGASALDEEFCELGEAFTDYINSTNINIPAGAIRVESAVAGVRTSAFHAGVIGAGYIAYHGANSWDAALSLTKPNTIINGFEIVVEYSGNGYGDPCLVMPTELCLADRMILRGINSVSLDLGFGINCYGVVSGVVNCLVVSLRVGIAFGAYVAGMYVRNCTFSKNNHGVIGVSGGTNGSTFYNTVSIGNVTTDWDTTNSQGVGSHNAGPAGTAWMTAGATRYTASTADFADYTNNNFRLSATSSLIDAAAEHYGIQPYDLSDDERPNYNNGGAEAFDVGCYEFDHGYGNHPASTTVTFSGVNAGSEIRVYDASGNELTGVESSAANPELTWVLSTGDVRIVVVHLSYKIKDFQYTPVSGAVSLPVQQEADSWYSNPA